ncbi:hypothetical protein C8T65DRAFT_536460, partial [Cerioporus squamosus]
RSLLDFTHISSFSFRAPGLYKIDDALLESMAKAWPHLESLSLADRVDCVHLELRVTLKALSQFALHCPQMEILSLQLDA